MTRKVPIVATIVVLAAVATMIALGFWQLDRRQEKEAMIARYEAALNDAEPQPFPADLGGAFEGTLFHPTAFECIDVLSREAVAGQNAQGQTGFAHIVRCQTGRGPADVKLGWSNRPEFPEYSGGVVEGLVVPGGKDGARVQAIPALAGLEPLSRPDPADLPNNHLSYAVQWFLFALTALAIYALALRRKWRASEE